MSGKGRKGGGAAIMAQVYFSVLILKSNNLLILWSDITWPGSCLITFTIHIIYNHSSLKSLSLSAQQLISEAN